MATIKAIEGRSVHQIQSGQVIVDLISVVKELVENSLDAGATSIEVRFKNNGLESIEVQDNGKGIAPEDFETIALKHYTSKLSSYEDLTSLGTFGFRGEALSSLCALSDFHIVTARPQDDAVGKKLEFETSGQLKSTSVVAAQGGTTVSVENLFGNLPVRRKELEKNIKREYGKAINHLYAYACISVGVRFSVTNQMPKAKKTPVFSTKSNSTTKENITNIFGAKTLLALVKLDLLLEMEPSKGPSTQSARNWSTQATDRSKEVRVQGHISKPTFGEGRQAPDRQMFFVNSRLCKLPQVTKAFNEVYKSFNVSQSPFIFANLILDTNAYDVNVSPDKREILLHDQTALLERLKSSLVELFEHTDHTMPQSQLPNRKLPSYKPLTVPRRSRQEDTHSTKGTGDESSEESGSEEDEPEHANGTTGPKRTHVDSSPTSLIRNWVERGTEMRSDKATTKTRQESMPTENETVDEANGRKILEKPKVVTARERLIDDMETSALDNIQVAPQQGLDHDTNSEDELLPAEHSSDKPDQAGPLSDDIPAQRLPDLPKPVQDFNALMDRSRVSLQTQPKEANDAPSSPHETSPGEDSPMAIPSVAPSSQKATPGPIQNTFDRMRPKRTPYQTAEITVGNTTTTAVIGNVPPYKKRKVHQPVHSQSIAQFGGSPLLARGLRNFAAPGSQLEVDSSNVLSTDRQQSEFSDDDNDSQESSAEAEDGVTSPPDRPTGGVTRRTNATQTSSNAPSSDLLDELLPVSPDDDEYDADYIDDEDKKLKEEEKVARLIAEAESTGAQPSEQNLKWASQVLKNGGNRKESTLQLARYLSTSMLQIRQELEKRKIASEAAIPPKSSSPDQNDNVRVKDTIDDSNAESRLSLTVSKSDFERMIIVGQFNLGFILAVRPATNDDDEDELFIIDQHAADEKYNYERLQRTVTLQSQRLVRPKVLDLTAVEEEIILHNAEALKANGFEIEIEIETASTIPNDNDEDEDEDESAGHRRRQRCRLLTLPMTREKTFEISDLEELLHFLSENPTTAGISPSVIPRPKKVQAMLAMRACRSSIMVGRTLTAKQMRRVVAHMGEMEKPWNCPHGRPTMRHLAGLGGWDGWREGEWVGDGDGSGGGGGETDWKGFLERRK